MEAKLLIVDDDEGVRLSLQDYFIREGFDVVVAKDGNEALQILNNTPPNLIILDVQLPYKDGIEICTKIRQKTGQTMGIIMISGVKKEMVDKIVGLEVGADVYMTKPFETRELLAQVRALLRRMQAEYTGQEASRWLIVDDYLRINFDQRIVEASGEEIHLTRLEFDLLKHLTERPGVPVGRSDLIDAIWEPVLTEGVSDGAVNVCVSKLRAKIEPDLSNPRYILSVHGIGYKFKDYRSE